MPRYMLDTNICVYLMSTQPPQVAARFATCYVGDVIISAITLAELEFGIVTSTDQSKARKSVLALTRDIIVAPFDAAAAHSYAPIRLATRDRKRDQLDKLIAAHAISLGVTLVTNNVRDFAAYSGLQIQNWLDND
jgi:tRNA(fMet)-specific endonuclease VapC